LLSYEGQKPLKPEYHHAIDRWVRAGGVLLYVGDGSDPYHAVREWWNKQGENARLPSSHLFELLGIQANLTKPQPVGQGFVLVVNEHPAALANEASGAERVRQWVHDALELTGSTLELTHYLTLRRGPYILSAVFDESISSEPVQFEGAYISLFDPTLALQRQVSLLPGDAALLYDAHWAREHLALPAVAAASTRIRDEVGRDRSLTFRTRGPVGTTARIQVLLAEDHAPVRVELTPPVPFEQRHEAEGGTLMLSFENAAEDVVVRIAF
jgi:hypothetical protein